MSDLGAFEDDLVEQALEDLRERSREGGGAPSVRDPDSLADNAAPASTEAGAVARTQPGPYSNKAPIEPFTEAEMQAEIDRRDELARRVNRACAEIGREVGYRRSCYPRWVRGGKMEQSTADRQIADLEDAATLLRELSGVAR